MNILALVKKKKYFYLIYIKKILLFEYNYKLYFIVYYHLS